MSTLYDITGEFLNLYEMATGEEDEQTFLDTLESLQYELQDKAAGYANVIAQLEMESSQCELVIDDFKKKRERRQNSIKRMKEALMTAMDVAGLDKLPAGDYTMKIAKNGGLQPLKITGDVPDFYCKVVVEPDNQKIREALKEGEKLDFAYLEERGRHLNIK